MFIYYIHNLFLMTNEELGQRIADNISIALAICTIVLWAIIIGLLYLAIALNPNISNTQNSLDMIRMSMAV